MSIFFLHACALQRRFVSVVIYVGFLQLILGVPSLLTGVCILPRVEMYRNQPEFPKISSEFPYCHQHMYVVDHACIFPHCKLSGRGDDRSSLDSLSSGKGMPLTLFLGAGTHLAGGRRCCDALRAPEALFSKETECWSANEHHSRSRSKLHG